MRCSTAHNAETMADSRSSRMEFHDTGGFLRSSAENARESRYTMARSEALN